MILDFGDRTYHSFEVLLRDFLSVQFLVIFVLLMVKES